MATEQYFCFSRFKKFLRSEHKRFFFFILFRFGDKDKKGNFVKYLESLYGCQFIIRS